MVPQVVEYVGRLIVAHAAQQPYPNPGYIDLPQYRSGLSHPALLWFRGAVWAFVPGSGEAGVVEYRPRGEQR